MGKSVEWCNTVYITAGLLLNSAAYSKIIKLKPSYSSMTHFNVGWTVALFKSWPWATLWSGPGCTYACWNSHLHTPKRRSERSAENLLLSADTSMFPSLMRSLMNLLVLSNSISWHWSRSLNSGLSKKESLNSSVGSPMVIETFTADY